MELQKDVQQIAIGKTINVNTAMQIAPILKTVKIANHNAIGTRQNLLAKMYFINSEIPSYLHAHS